MSTKEEIVKKVQAALEHEPRINLHRYPVHLDFQEGILTIEGDMEHLAAKKIALDLASAVPGVNGIVDRIRVIPTRPMGDGAIRDHVRDAFLQESALENCAIYVQRKGETEIIREAIHEPTGSIEIAVENGVVTLNGWVPSLSHKRLAGVLAWWVPGSREVINGLEVIPSQEDNDNEVTDAVRLVLEKDRFIDASQIHVHTHNYVVTLEGLVPNEAIKEMAEYDAWCIFGVRKVINKLIVQA